MRQLDYSNTNHFARTEPRIGYIKSLLESILSLVDLEKDGQIVKIDGFRLKKNEDWLLKLPMSPLVNVGSFSSYCNCQCKFCFESGNPPDQLSYSRGSGQSLSIAEVKTRLKYFNAKSQCSIARANSPSMEPFMNSYCLEILSVIKKTFPNRFLAIETNGTFLTREVIQRLAMIGVDEVEISLNSAAPDIRRSVMCDLQPKTAIEAIRLLKEFKVPYTGSIVPWPSVPLGNLKQTVQYLDENEALMIRVNLPGYTKYQPPAKLFKEDFWMRVVKLICAMKRRIQTPIVFSPSLYAKNDNVPRVIGVMRNSSAEKAGLRPDDIVLEVESIKVATHFEARYYIEKFQLQPFRMQILRDGNMQVLKLFPLSEYKYPYTKSVSKLINPTGIVMHEGFQLIDLRRLAKILAWRQSKNVLFLSSRIMKPLFEEQLQRFCDLRMINFRIEVPEHQFWGGNIIVGGLYTVDDFVEHVERLLSKEQFVPDLIIIPSSPFSEWGRDLTGKVYTEIERQVKIPVEILKTLQTLE